MYNNAYQLVEELDDRIERASHALGMSVGELRHRIIESWGGIGTEQHPVIVEFEKVVSTLIDEQKIDEAEKEIEKFEKVFPMYPLTTKLRTYIFFLKNDD